MCLCIVDDVADACFDEEAGFFVEELDGEAEEEVLLRRLWEGTDEYAGDVVVTAQVRDVVDVVDVVVVCDVGDWEGVGYGCVGV